MVYEQELWPIYALCPTVGQMPQKWDRWDKNKGRLKGGLELQTRE